jgi:hypothetical protein
MPEIDKLDFQEIFRVALTIVAKEGIRTNIEAPDFSGIKKTILWNLKVFVLLSHAIPTRNILLLMKTIHMFYNSKVSEM